MAHKHPENAGRVDFGSIPRGLETPFAGGVMKNINTGDDYDALKPKETEQITRLRERFQLQLQQWQTEIDGLDYISDSLQSEAINRARRFLAHVDSQIRLWDTSSGTSDVYDKSGGQRKPPYSAMRSQLRQWECEVGELRAIAYKADAQARQTYQLQVKTLHSGIDATTRQWQLDMSTSGFRIDEVLTPDDLDTLKLTRYRLNELDNTDSGMWQGFANAVEAVLSQVEQQLRLVLDMIPADCSNQ